MTLVRGYSIGDECYLRLGNISLCANDLYGDVIVLCVIMISCLTDVSKEILLNYFWLD